MQSQIIKGCNELKGKHIQLRPLKESDLVFLNQWKNDESIYKYLGGGFIPVSYDQQKNWISSLIDMTGNNKRFLILSPDQVPVGMIGLYGINWIHRTCECGLFIGDSEARGKGYAFDAWCTLEHYAKCYLNLRKINLKVVSENKGGFNLWKKCGFVQVGVLHEERFIDGKYCDVVLMEKFL